MEIKGFKIRRLEIVCKKKKIFVIVWEFVESCIKLWEKYSINEGKLRIC